MADDDAADDDAPRECGGSLTRSCRAVLGIDCVLPLDHDGRHVRQHEDDLRRRSADGE